MEPITGMGQRLICEQGGGSRALTGQAALQLRHPGRVVIAQLPAVVRGEVVPGASDTWPFATAAGRTTTRPRACHGV